MGLGRRSADGGVGAVVDLDVAAHQGTRGAAGGGPEGGVGAGVGGRQVGVQLLAVLDQVDLVVVGTGIGDDVRIGYREVLARGVGVAAGEARQGVDELGQGRAVGPVGGGVVVGDPVEGVQRDRSGSPGPRRPAAADRRGRVAPETARLSTGQEFFACS